MLKANNPDKFRDRIEQLNIQDIDIDKLSPEMLDKIVEHLIQKALVGKPEAVVAEARRRIEAGGFASEQVAAPQAILTVS